MTRESQLGLAAEYFALLKSQLTEFDGSKMVAWSDSILYGVIQLPLLRSIFTAIYPKESHRKISCLVTFQPPHFCPYQSLFKAPIPHVLPRYIILIDISEYRKGRNCIDREKQGKPISDSELFQLRSLEFELIFLNFQQRFLGSGRGLLVLCCNGDG